MNRSTLTFLVLISCTQTLFAQKELKLTLDEARELGLKNRFDVKAREYDIDISKASTKIKQEEYLPDFRMVGNVNYHPQIQGTLIPPGFAGLSQPTYLALGAKSISVFSLELHQTIYNPVLATDVRISEKAQQLQLEKKHQFDIEVRKQISQYYLNALLRQFQAHIAANEQERFKQYFSLAEGRFQNGALLENDYLRAKLDFENAQQQAFTSNQQYELSLVALRYVLNVAQDTRIVLIDSLEAAHALTPPKHNIGVPINRTELRQLDLQVQNDELAIEKLNKSRLPSIMLTGNYSQQYLNMDFNYNYADGKWWSPFNSVGLQASLPLTSQFTSRTKLKQARLKLLQTAQVKSQTQAQINYEVQGATTDMRNAIFNLDRTKNNYELAQKVLINQKQQFDFGAFSYDALLNTESSMITAERNYITAAYELLIAKLNFDFAVGEL